MTAAELNAIASRMEYPGHWFAVFERDGNYLLQLRYYECDVDTGAMTEQHARKWYVSAHATESEVVRTALLACLISAEHRVREHFLYDGRRLFGPHISVAALGEVAPRVDRRPGFLETNH